MATTLKSFDFIAATPRNRHNWDELTDGKIRRLTSGVDFQGKPASMMSGCKIKAKSLGLDVQVAIEDGDEDTPGAIVECGCALGNSTAKLSIVAKHLDKKLYVFDSFEGLPNVYDFHYKFLEDRQERKLTDPSESSVDGWYPVELYPGTKTEAKNSNPVAQPNANLPDASRNEYKFKTGAFSAQKEVVVSNVQRYGEIDNVEFIEGWFSDTLRQKLDKLTEPIAAAFVDVDLLLSHQQCFDEIWPRMSEKAYYFSHESQSELIRDFYHSRVGEFNMLFKGKKINSHLMYFRQPEGN